MKLGKFVKVFSHNKLLEGKIPNFQYIPHGGTWLRDGEMGVFDKSKSISMIYSDKQWNLVIDSDTVLYNF